MSRYVTKSEIKFIHFSLGIIWLIIAIAVPTFIRFMNALSKGADLRDAILYAWGLL